MHAQPIFVFIALDNLGCQVYLIVYITLGRENTRCVVNVSVERLSLKF